MIAKLEQGLEKLGLELSVKQKENLCTYIALVLEFNKGYNLMKAEDEDEMAVSHVLDSLAGVPHIKALAQEKQSASAEPIVIGDIGSGGGCPGIPLAIALSEYNFVLVERMEKRYMFLDSVIQKLSLNNAKTLPLQAEKVPKESFDIEVFRAFHPFDKKIAKTLFTMLKKNGSIAAYKARAEKISVEMDSVKDIIPSYRKVQLTVPFLEDHERNLVIINKGDSKK